VVIIHASSYLEKVLHPQNLQARDERCAGGGGYVISTECHFNFPLIEKDCLISFSEPDLLRMQP
jgi:hypothetical protein